jgi:hypothetical protein
MGLVAALGCRACARYGVFTKDGQVHHQRSGQGRKRASDWRTVLLCWEHHHGPTGVHGMGTKAFPRHHGFTEEELVAECWQLLGVTEAQVLEWEADRQLRQAIAKARPKARRPKAEGPKRAWAQGRKIRSKNTLKYRDFGRHGFTY